MRRSYKQILFGALATLVFSFVIFQIFSINRSAEKKLAEERARLIEQNSVPFEKKTLTPHSSPNVQILQNTNTVRDFARFRNSYYAATTGGLVQIADDGKIIKHFTVLDGLPESDLTCLKAFGDKLFIGTQTKNLIVFDGETFENYRWTDRRAGAVTSFLENDGKLLIGTARGGLLEFDGVTFAEIKAGKTRITAVNCLLRDGAKIYVGTFDDGLWIYEGNVWAHFTIAEGLPSNRVVGVAVKDRKLLVATDFGLTVLEEKIFRAIDVVPSLTSLISHNNRIFLTKDDGALFTFDDSTTKFALGKNLQNARLVQTDEKLFLLTNQGVEEIKGTKIKSFVQPQTESLTDNFVSALAFDRRENLWVGTFRRGIDVFSAESRKIKHLETESVREINYLESQGETISAATSSGLINFKNDFAAENFTKKDGLPSNSITHFAGDFMATAKGLAFRENGRIRILSTVQGLPNNSVYAALQMGKTVYAGTLGGLVKIENGRIARTFKDSNSNLTTNWVTALCLVNERLFIGTYGGGIFELLPSGEIHSFAAETGKFTVNPNAIFSDGERLYAGTLEGVKTLDLQTQEWRTVKSVLPAETVMSVTGNEKSLYFGTTNGIAAIEKSYFEGQSE